jgi:predicted ArsR family transcriptional regulator
MEGLMQPDQLRARVLLWTEEEIRLNRLPPKSGAVLEAALYRGELPRGDAAAIVGTGERQARRVVSALIERGVLISESTRAPLRGMPGLFPERT